MPNSKETTSFITNLITVIQGNEKYYSWMLNIKNSETNRQHKIVAF